MTEEEKEKAKIILAKITKEAKANGYKLTDNKEKIARAKANFFGVDNWRCCPCDPNSTRACISERCHEEIRENGLCHCRLYKK